MGHAMQDMAAAADTRVLVRHCNELDLRKPGCAVYATEQAGDPVQNLPAAANPSAFPVFRLRKARPVGIIVWRRWVSVELCWFDGLVNYAISDSTIGGRNDGSQNYVPKMRW